MKVIVIGSGIAGLASAIRLAQDGFEVEVFESAAVAGGKLDSLSVNGFRFDTGPSLFTLPTLVDDLFLLCNKNPREYFNYQQLNETCRYFWEDGKKIIASAEIDEFANECQSQFGIEAKKIRNYFKSSAFKYTISKPVFLDNSLHLKKNYFTKRFVRGILNSPRLHLLSSMHRVNSKKLKEPHLVQLFDRFATYNGSNPFSAPGILTLIPHLEHKLGAYFPVGGMYAIVEAMHKLANDLNVKFNFNSRVKKINTDQGIAKSIVVEVGNEQKIIDTDIVISNADIYSTYKHLLDDQPKVKALEKQERSSSALIFYWGINRSFDQLGLHNILFSTNYEKEFDGIFKTKIISDDLTVYIHISSKINVDDAPSGCENWFVLVNVPGKSISENQRTKIRHSILNKINAILNVDLEKHIVAERFLDPDAIESKTSSHLGSLYGTSSNSRTAAFFRHPNFSKSISNLFFCGGSVHPGGGIPLALKSAKITSELIINKYAVKK